MSSINMIKGIGIDLARISRFTDKEKLEKRVLSEEENKVFNTLLDIQKPKYLASRFALKEAYYKASQNNCSFKDVTFLNDKQGKPYMLNREDVHVSLTDEDDYVIAFIVIEEKKD